MEESKKKDDPQELNIPYNFAPIDSKEATPVKEGREAGKEDNKSPRITYSITKNLSHPAHGEQLSLWPEMPPQRKNNKMEKIERQPFYFTPIQHQLIRAFSIYLSQHGDNDKIKKFKREIEEGEAGFFSEPIPISNTEIGKIIYGNSYRKGTDGDRVFNETLKLANMWVAQKVEIYPLNERGERSTKPRYLRFSSPVIQIEARVDDPDGDTDINDPDGDTDIDISLIRFGRILLERLDTQWIPQPLTVFNIRNEKGRKITTELSYTLLAELETLWKNVMGAEAAEKKSSEKGNKKMSKAEKDQQTEQREKALWRELLFSTIKETCSTKYDSTREMKGQFKKHIREAFFGYKNSIGIITAYEIKENEGKVKFRLNPYYGKK